MSHRGVFVILAAVGAATTPAHADRGLALALALADDDEVDADAGDEPRLITAADRARAEADDDDDEVRPRDHHGQLGVALQIPFGLRVIKPYEAGEYCGVRGGNEMLNAEVCVGRTPQSFDLALSYGVKPHLEVLLELRLGIERDFGATVGAGSGPRLFHWSPGVKFYFSDAGATKLFSTAQIAFDHTGYDDARGNPRGVDFALRNVNGLQLDLHPSYGLYFFVAEELAFRRWLMLGVEAGIGIQGRYP